MSAEAMAWAKRYRTGGPTKKLLLLVLADYADEAGSCFPGQALLAELTELGERTVRRLLGELEADGLLRRERRTRANGSRTSDRIWLQVGKALPATVAGPAPTPDLPATDGRPTGHSVQGQPATVAGPDMPVEGLEEPPAPPVAPHGSQLALVANPSPAALGGEPRGFADFWAVYPRRTGKGAARAAYAKAVRKVGADVVIAGAARLAQDPNLPEPQYIPNPATWLNQERWADDPLPARGAAGPTSVAGSATRAFMAIAKADRHPAIAAPAAPESGMAALARMAAGGQQ